MRYVILKSQISEEEISARKKYIESIFNIYTILYKRDNYIELVSFPSNVIDLILIKGHNYIVYDYLKQNIPKERNVVLITCYTGDIKRAKLHNKNLYVSKNRNGVTDTFDGKNWNIHFQITDSELTFYNNKDRDLTTKLEKSFERIR